jgi:chromosome segregation ATPase
MPKSGALSASVEDYKRRLKFAEQRTGELVHQRDAAEARVLELRATLDETAPRLERASRELEEAERKAKLASQNARRLNQRLATKNTEHRSELERTQAMAKQLQARNEGLVENAHREAEQRAELSDQLARVQRDYRQLEQDSERERLERQAELQALRQAVRNAELERDNLERERAELSRSAELADSLRRSCQSLTADLERQKGNEHTLLEEAVRLRQSLHGAKAGLETYQHKQVQLVQEADDLRALLEHLWFLSARSLDLTVGSASVVALKLAWSSLAEFARRWGKVDGPDQLTRTVGEQLARAGLVDGIDLERADDSGNWRISLLMARHVDPPSVRWLAAYVVGCFSAGLSIDLRVQRVHEVERRVIVTAALGPPSAGLKAEVNT